MSKLFGNKPWCDARSWLVPVVRIIVAVFFYYLTSRVITVGDVRDALILGMEPFGVSSHVDKIIVLQSSATSVLCLSKQYVNYI